jgi:hypothetical protein
MSVRCVVGLGTCSPTPLLPSFPSSHSSAWLTLPWRSYELLTLLPENAAGGHESHDGELRSTGARGPAAAGPKNPARVHACPRAGASRQRRGAPASGEARVRTPPRVTHARVWIPNLTYALFVGLSATSQQYFSLTTNQPPATSQYSSLRTNQHQPPANRTGC